MHHYYTALLDIFHKLKTANPSLYTITYSFNLMAWWLLSWLRQKRARDGDIDRYMLRERLDNFCRLSTLLVNNNARVDNRRTDIGTRAFAISPRFLAIVRAFVRRANAVQRLRARFIWATNWPVWTSGKI